jgi:hydrogenase nickel incorporation protein HypB
MCGHCGCERPAAPSRLELQRGLLERNDHLALHNRKHFAEHGLLTVNVMSAPGSGKTALLEQLAKLWPQKPLGVIVGDQATDHDAQRLADAGARSIQIRTGALCHLEASLVDEAFRQLDHAGMNLLVIENVGNLVCPTAFDLGETLRVALLSVTEGEDKPLKYPGLFRSAHAVVINKLDLAQAAGFDRNLALANVQAITPAARVFETSARTGEGLEELMAWLQDELPR